MGHSIAIVEDEPLIRINHLLRKAELVADNTTITSPTKRIRKKFIAVASNVDAIGTTSGVSYRWKP